MAWLKSHTVTCGCGCGRTFKMSEHEYRKKIKASKSGKLFFSPACFEKWRKTPEGRTHLKKKYGKRKKQPTVSVPCACGCNRLIKISEKRYNLRLKAAKAGLLFYSNECFIRWRFAPKYEKRGETCSM
jgi:phage pi2 protein 07